MSKILSAIIGITILSLSVTTFGAIVFNKKVKSKLRMVVTLTVCVSAWTLSVIYLNSEIKTVFVFLICIFLYMQVFKVDVSKAIFTSIIYMLVLMFSDMAYTTIVVGIVGVKSDIYYSNIARSILTNIFVGGGAILIALLLKNELIKLLKSSIVYNFIIIVLSILTFVCVSTFFYGAFSNIKFDVEFFLNVGIIIAFLFILGNLIKEKIDNNKKIVEYNESLKFLKVYEKEIENNQIENHETKNKFITVRSKIEDGSSKEEVIGYLNQVINEQVEMNQDQFSKFQYLPSNGIKTLFYYKFSYAHNLGIVSNINISKDIETSMLNSLSLEEFDQFSMIIGVFLDNAIEASNNSQEKSIGLEMYVIDEDVIIMISNSYSNNIDVNKIGIKNFSTKGAKRGHGLLLVKKIVDKNEMFEIERIITLNIYTQKLIVKKK